MGNDQKLGEKQVMFGFWAFCYKTAQHKKKKMCRKFALLTQIEGIDR